MKGRRVSAADACMPSAIAADGLAAIGTLLVAWRRLLWLPHPCWLRGVNKKCSSLATQVAREV